MYRETCIYYSLNEALQELGLLTQLPLVRSIEVWIKSEQEEKNHIQARNIHVLHRWLPLFPFFLIKCYPRLAFCLSRLGFLYVPKCCQTYCCMLHIQVENISETLQEYFFIFFLQGVIRDVQKPWKIPQAGHFSQTKVRGIKPSVGLMVL